MPDINRPGDVEASLTQFEIDLADGSLIDLKIDELALAPEQSAGTLRKGTGVLHAYPLDGKELSVVDRKVMNAIIIHVQRVFAAIPIEDQEKIRDPKIRGTPRFSIRITSLANYVRGNSDPNLVRVYASLENLWKWEFRYNVTSDKFRSPEASSNFFSSRGRFFSDLAYGSKDELPNGHIEFVIPHSTLMMILEPAMWALLSLHVINAMRSSALIALYENCARYLNTENRTTALLPVQEWINIISGEGRYVDQYARWKDKVIKPIMAILQASNEISFTIAPVERRSTRNKVVALQFQMTMKAQSSIEASMPISWHPSNLEVLRNIYKLTDADIARLSATYTEPEVVEAMEKASQQMAKKAKSQEPVGNRKAYLLGVLRKTKEIKADGSLEEDPQTLMQIRVHEAKGLLEKQKTDFVQFQYKVLASKLDGMDKAELDALRHRFMDERGASIPEKSLKIGWASKNPLLDGSFRTWIMETQELMNLFLTEEYERDFLTWKMLNELGDKSPI